MKTVQPILFAAICMVLASAVTESRTPEGKAAFMLCTAVRQNSRCDRRASKSS